MHATVMLAVTDKLYEGTSFSEDAIRPVMDAYWNR
jgi:hypothetical protein